MQERKAYMHDAKTAVGKPAAHIGGGIIIMLGGPVLLLVTAATLLGLRLLRHPRAGDGS